MFEGSSTLPAVPGHRCNARRQKTRSRIREREVRGLQKGPRVGERVQEIAFNLSQENLHRSRVANELLHQMVREKGIVLLFISEQYLQSPPDGFWHYDSTNTAAIWVVDTTKTTVDKKGNEQGFV